MDSAGEAAADKEEMRARKVAYIVLQNAKAEGGRAN